jgi:hypothetical protein
MWGAANTSHVRTQSTYQAAFDTWSKSKPWRNATGEHDYRPISQDSRKRKHMSVRKRDDGAIAFRLYSTDCVIFHPNGEIEFEPYTSVTTNAFVNAILPHGIRVSYNDHHNIVHISRGYWHEERKSVVYDIKGGARFKKLGEVEASELGYDYELSSGDDTIEPFEKFSIDGKVAFKARRESGFEGFRDFMMVAGKMGYDPTAAEPLPKLEDERNSYGRLDFHKSQQCLAAMKEPEMYRALGRTLYETLDYNLKQDRVSHAFGNHQREQASHQQRLVNGVIDAARELVYKNTPDLIVTEEFRSLDHYKKVDAIKKSASKYRFFT